MTFELHLHDAHQISKCIAGGVCDLLILLILLTKENEPRPRFPSHKALIGIISENGSLDDVWEKRGNLKETK